MALGRFDEALTQMNQAYELDQQSPVINLALGSRLFYARQYPQAIEQCQKTLIMDAAFVPAHVFLGRAYQQKGSHQQAIAELRIALDLSGGDSNELAALANAYALSRQLSDAGMLLQQLQQRSQQTYVEPSLLATIYLGLGQKEQAFNWLQKAYEDRSAALVYLKVDPAFDSIRFDTRFIDLLRRVGLSQ
jgi:tetratricopeptide (TPR) repeat protein